MSTLMFYDWFDHRGAYDAAAQEASKTLIGLYRRAAEYPVEGPIVLVTRPSVPSAYIPPGVTEVILFRTDDPGKPQQIVDVYGASYARILTDREIADLFARASCD